MEEDTKRRSIVKAICYRALIMCSDGVIVYAITHRYDVALTVIVLSNVASTLFYFLYERFWSRIAWGRVRIGNVVK